MPTSDLDRGAIAAIRLLRRSMEVTEDETEWDELAEGLVDGIEREGLRAMVRLEIDFEREFIEECAATRRIGTSSSATRRSRSSCGPPGSPSRRCPMPPADPPAALTALAAALHDEFDYECCFVKWPDGTSEHSTGAKYWPTRAARVLAALLALPASERDALAAALAPSQEHAPAALPTLDVETERRSHLYRRQSTEARREIESWPKWMRDNLRPTMIRRDVPPAAPLDPPQELWDANLREALIALPEGSWEASRYDTDDEHVLHLWPERGGESWDLVAPKVARTGGSDASAAYEAFLRHPYGDDSHLSDAEKEAGLDGK